MSSTFIAWNLGAGSTMKYEVIQKKECAMRVVTEGRRKASSKPGFVNPNISNKLVTKGTAADNQEKRMGVQT